MQDIAEAAGVSPMTVSNCFRYPDRVRAKTREAVMKVAAELGYVPNMSAGLLAAGTSRVIRSTTDAAKLAMISDQLDQTVSNANAALAAMRSILRRDDEPTPS